MPSQFVKLEERVNRIRRSCSLCSVVIRKGETYASCVGRFRDTLNGQVRLHRRAFCLWCGMKIRNEINNRKREIEGLTF